MKDTLKASQLPCRMGESTVSKKRNSYKLGVMVKWRWCTHASFWGDDLDFSHLLTPPFCIQEAGELSREGFGARECCCLVDKSCLTLCDSRDCSLPGSSVDGSLQARILEWIAMPSSRWSSWVRDQTCISRWILYHWATRETRLFFKWREEKPELSVVGERLLSK